MEQLEVMMLDDINEEILAENVDAETFMRDYADLHAEWVNGMVIKMSPVSDVHNLLTQFLITFFTLYRQLTVVIRLPAINRFAQNSQVSSITIFPSAAP